MKEKEMKLLTKNNREPTLLGKFNMKHLPTIYFVAAEFSPQDLTQRRDKLSSLGDDYRFVIGRNPLCNIQIDAYTISDVHAYLLKKGNHVLLYDVSKFGTYVKEKKSWWKRFRF